jgi:uncharacterized lipoprotein YmbA
MTTRRTMVLLLLLTGCSFLSKSKSKIYSLERIDGAPVAVRGLPIGIGTIELPPGIDRKEVAVRKADHQLEVRGNELWSAPLEAAVLHTLAFDLASRLPEGMVVLPGQSQPGAMRTIDVVFGELAAGPEAKVVLDARWIVANVAHHERIVVDVPSLDSASVADGVSRALGMLADRIAGQL